MKLILTILKPWLLATWCLAALAMNARGDVPIRLHLQNGHYFEFRGKPVVLVGSTEQYASLFNLDFDYLRYLDELQACGLNLTRAFTGTYRQFPGFSQTSNDTPLDVPTERFIAPWPRTGGPGAGDGGNKFDLTKWDAAYFHRLRAFVAAASERGIVVEITLFCSFYQGFSHVQDRLWDVSPMNARNHINGVGAGGATACFSPNNDLLPFQKALVRKFTEEMQGFDNVFFEATNEPYYYVSPAWEVQIIDELVAAESTFPHRHLIAQNIANYEKVITSPNPKVSIFNFHYAYPSASFANQGLNRVIGNDETSFIGTDDLPYRSEAWRFMLSGGGLEDHLDRLFTTRYENGIASPVTVGGGGPALRRQLGILRWFLQELPLVRCAPQTNVITGGVPSGVFSEVFAAPGEAYGIYVLGGTQVNLVANLPAGTYRGRWINPRSGEVMANLGEFTHGGGSKTLASPVYDEDIALMMFGGSMPPPEVALTEPVYQTVVAAGATLTFKANAIVANGTLDRVEFLDGEQVIGMASAPPYNLTVDGMTKGMHVFRARAIASDGRQALSPPVKCAVMGAFRGGVNLNGPAVVLNGQTWISSADAVTSGMVLSNSIGTITSASLPLYPVPDPATRALVSSQILLDTAAGNELAIAYPLAAGTYDLFFTLIEGETAYVRNVNVSIEGNILTTGIGGMDLGECVNFGPYRITVSDGMLNLGFVRSTKGIPKVANFSLYEAQAPVALADAWLNIHSASGVALLSWPAGVPAGRVETSTTLNAPASWLPLNLPPADFTDFQEIVVPLADPRRFFRLKKD